MSCCVEVKKYCLLCWPWIATTGYAILSYNLRDVRFSYRWLTGFCIIRLMSRLNIQSYSNEEWKKILPSIFIDNIQTNYWLLLHMTLAMTKATSFIGIYGGSKYYKKHGIDSYKKAIISSLCPGQVYFIKNKNARYKALKQLLRLFGIIGIGYSISKLFHLNPKIIDKIENNKILNMEILALLVSIQILSINIPTNIHYLIFAANDDIHVIEPYDFVFFSNSIRTFWKNWSRPVGEALQYMIYKPLGGRDRFWLSVPTLFFVNCTLHYDWTMTLYGYRSISVWNKAFLWMAASISLHILTENIFLKHKKINDSHNDDNNKENIEDNIYWKIWCFGLFNVSMATTLYIVHEKAMIMNIKNVSNTLLGEIAFNI